MLRPVQTQGRSCAWSQCKRSPCYFGGPARYFVSAQWADNYWFDVVAEDHGEPGRQDTYQIAIRTYAGGQAGNVVYEASGTLAGGNIQFFPQGTDVTSVCSYAYGTPLVALTPLTSAQPLIATIDATQPAGGTPTLPALEGAVAYALQVAAAHPADKTVVVLATDGDPGFGVNGQFEEGCTNNDIPHVAAVAQAALAGTPSIPTYVIGVGPDLQNLDAIAAAGGTGQAMVVPVSDPTQTNVVFENALNSIRAASLSCQLTIPQPPNGQTINPDGVNVVLVSGSGQQNVLTYSADCSNPNGWHYDNPAAPRTVLLCTGACTTARSDAAGKVTLAFGCFTSGLTQ